ncbi:NAD(P)/FAD-dependent oxidoreductase [Antrihabitans sp. YC2-6]|uniref:NAD(P)/FAD-dependent oxidoreductase n=1 Tax=Antrihabitans sp. YC2-6 TaxID=2799498 RepID=UPI0018F5B0C5|nr:NAD(P)/FAD-dependent oxidoreductase [Antrihabitans sp. YC2-6]MBJ8345437.1 NAD(P)/FAD-dependent oxidoreductase [Antrihabitans sp. YC2-6]
MNENYDVVIVGGGAAGLGGAMALARARRSVLVIDDGTPRNAPAGHVHNYLGREGTPPLELVQIGRAEVAAYGGEFKNARVTAVEPVGGPSFRVTTSDGVGITARRLLIATGLVDELPDIPGVAQRWGRDVLHCPYCHGWEVRDQAIGVIATSFMAVHQALLFRQLSPHVTFFQHTAPALSAEEIEQLAARDVPVVTGEIATLDITDDKLSGVVLRSGELHPLQAVVVAPRFTARVDMLAGLGLEPVELEHNGHVIGSFIPADAQGATSVPGVSVAGNVADPKAQVIVSAASGLTAGAFINADLVNEDVRDAIAARVSAR